MKLEIDFKQPSTVRGAVWVVTGVIGAVTIFMGKDVGQLMTLAATVAGGLGVAVKD